MHVYNSKLYYLFVRVNQLFEILSDFCAISFYTLESLHSTYLFVSPSNMVKYSLTFKHNILTLYQPHSHTNGFQSLASQFNIKGGKRTIKYWYDHWDGTVQSLERRPTSGRPALLNTRQVKQYITTPIIENNKQHQPIHYTTLHQTLKSKINKSISLRSVQRYGKERAGVKKKRTKKYMNGESKYIQTNDIHVSFHLHMLQQLI